MMYMLLPVSMRKINLRMSATTMDEEEKTAFWLLRGLLVWCGTSRIQTIAVLGLHMADTYCRALLIACLLFTAIAMYDHETPSLCMQQSKNMIAIIDSIHLKPVRCLACDLRGVIGGSSCLVGKLGRVH